MTSASSSGVWINADDFGWTDGHNLAIAQAHRLGILNRASLMANGGAFDEAVAFSRQMPDLKVGVHLTLNEGRPVSDPKRLPGLTRADGSFQDTLRPFAVWMLAGQLGRIAREQVLPEWRGQIERALGAGVVITHLDSHKHVHLIPPLREIAIKLAQEYQISYLRLPLDSLLHLAQRGPSGLVFWCLAISARRRFRRAGLQFADHFYGVGNSGLMTADYLERILRQPVKGSIEVMVHPAVITPAVGELIQTYRWAQSYRFEAELDALCKPQVRRTLEAI